MNAADDLAFARNLLWQRQAHWAAGVDALLDLKGRDVAQSRMAARRDPSLRDGDFVWDGPFRYRLETEQVRWARTQAIVDRVGPGPHEDGTYLELLARQAASVELTLIEIADNDMSSQELSTGELLSGVLLGTTGEPRSSASTTSIPGTSATAIALSAGMVYLMYQVAKAIVSSWSYSLHGEGPAAVSTRIDKVLQVLAEDSAPVEQLASTLIAWMIDGVPRPAVSRTPKPHEEPPLALLISQAERWVIAHEYCHALYDRSPPRNPPQWLPDVTTRWDKEFRADLLATIVLIRGGGDLDGMAPNMVLQGAVLAMQVHEIADRTIDLAHGGSGDPIWSSLSHPPWPERAERVFTAYSALVGTSLDMELVPAQFVALTLDELWSRSKPSVEAAIKAGPINSQWKRPPRA